MLLHIYIAHTGECLRAEPATFTSLETFRAWIAQRTTILAANQILMSTRSKQVKLQTLLSEKEVFVYDRALISPPSSDGRGRPSVPDVDVPEALTASAPPDKLVSPNDLGAWQTLYKSRRAWALELAEKCESVAEQIRVRLEEASVIERALGIAAANLATHVGNSEGRYAEATEWFQNLSNRHLSDQAWEQVLAGLRQIPVRPDAVVLLKSEISTATNAGEHLSLGDVVNAEEVRKARQEVLHAAEELERQLADVGADASYISERSSDLLASIKETGTDSILEMSEQSARVIEDVNILAKKISTDYEHVLSLPATPKSVSQASKMALVHTRNYLPSLVDATAEIARTQQQAIERRNHVGRTALENLQTVSSLESMLAGVNPKLASLDLKPEQTGAFEVVDFASRLPVIYGTVLIEAVRRREWTEKIKVDSASLAEELAGYQEEEESRRRKWQKSLGTVLHLPDKNEEKALGVEVNLQADSSIWPSVERQDVEDYIQHLRGGSEPEANIKELSQMLSDLDKPTRQQRRRTKAFKGESVHEAAMGRSLLSLRGGADDLVRSIRDEKTKVEDKLKGSESRVRKLEDLLHRQSQFGRSISGASVPPNQYGQSPDMFNPTYGRPPSALASPQLIGDHSRRSSLSSRRFSNNQGTEEKGLAQRVVSLEAELMAQREHSAGLEREMISRKETEKALRTQLEDGNSTKRDLMENLDAQQREFTDERRLLEGKLSTLRNRVEEAEDDVDRVLGSRDNERLATDERIKVLETELAQAQSSTKDDEAKHRDTIASLTNETHRLQDEVLKLQSTVDRAERECRKMVDQIGDLQLEKKQRDEAGFEHTKILRSAHAALVSDEEADTAPGKFGDLLEALQHAADQSADRLRNLESAVAIAHKDKALTETRLQEREAEFVSLQESSKDATSMAAETQTLLEEERAKVGSFKVELWQERSQLASLRARMAEGETGSGALKEKLEEEEARLASLNADISAKQMRVQTLEESLSRKDKDLEWAQGEISSFRTRLESRGVRAKDLTQRLFSRNERLRGLLESIGFVVTRGEDNSMLIQRVSRSSASTTENDGSSSLRRSISGSGLGLKKKAMEQSADLELLYWAQSEDSESENDRYDAFLATLGRFDTDAFVEAVTKRVKETEHIARKWQKEARGYREKAHRAQHDAHNKIAYRSFKDGDLALFLPTRNQATRPWAAFNVGAPHYFLREQDAHKLRSREWLLARISHVEERIVDLSQSLGPSTRPPADKRSLASSDGGASIDDENPFELSDGLRWYLLDAAEEKPGAPSTPGLGKSTVASAHVDARGSVRVAAAAKKNLLGGASPAPGASKTLSKSLDSRRSSINSISRRPASDAASRSSREVQPATSGAVSPVRPLPQDARDGHHERNEDDGVERDNIQQHDTPEVNTEEANGKKMWSFGLSLESGRR